MIAIAPSDVPVARRSPKPHHSTRSGTISTPPPTPKSPLNSPAAVPIAASLSVRLRGLRGILKAMSATAPLVEALEPLRADPAHAAILLDIDGTLAPIVRHADDA